MDGVVVGHDAIIVALAHVTDFVLGAGDFGLKLAEVSISFKIGIRFRYRKEATQRVGEHIISLHFCFRRRCAHDCRARLRDRRERIGLMRGITLDRLNKIGNQVKAALELHVNLRPSVVDAIAQLHQIVVEPNCDNGQDNQNHYDKDYDLHCSLLSLSSYLLYVQSVWDISGPFGMLIRLLKRLRDNAGG